MMDDRYSALDDNYLDDTASREPRGRRLLSWIKELIQLALIVVVVRVGMDVFLPRYVVDGASMEPSFHTNERVIVDRITMALSGPARGDVVVLASPTAPGDLLIKRVVGLPGEHIRIADGRVYVNGARLDEPYVTDFCMIPSCEGAWQLSDEEYFVLGDNRMHSLDSHSFGPVAESSLEGIARVRYWPLTQAGVLLAPEY